MKYNIKFKHAVLYKLSLIASLLFVALAVTLLGSQALDNQDFIFRNSPCLHGFTAVGTEHHFPVTKGESSGAIAGVAPKSGANLSGRACSARQTTVSETVQEPAQNLQQERPGDALCPTNRIPEQGRSAASNVQPADAAKISPAELWVRLLEEEKFSVEPAILEGNKIR